MPCQVYHGQQKACKSCLKLVKEYRGTSYDAMNAHVAIVFTRYMMLSVAQRENEDDKTICELCFCLPDETADITFSRSMCIIIDVLMDTVAEYFHITEAQLEELAARKYTLMALHLLKSFHILLLWKHIHNLQERKSKLV